MCTYTYTQAFTYNIDKRNHITDNLWHSKISNVSLWANYDRQTDRKNDFCSAQKVAYMEVTPWQVMDPKAQTKSNTKLVDREWIILLFYKHFSSDRHRQIGRSVFLLNPNRQSWVYRLITCLYNFIGDQTVLQYPLLIRVKREKYVQKVTKLCWTWA